MPHKYPVIGGLLLLTVVIIGSGNFAQRPGGQRQPVRTGTPSAPDGFRGINPPPAGAPDIGIAPTSTPSPTTTPDATPRSDSPFPRGVGTTYAVIPAGDVDMLEEALLAAKDLYVSQPGILYEIYLAAGTYLLDQTLVVWGNAALYGAHMDTTILKQNASHGIGGMNAMIKLFNGALTVDHVTLADGRTGANGGAIFVQNAAAVLTVTNATFLNNIADDSAGGGNGGAIYNTGAMILRNVYFRGNAAKRGGAIYNHAADNETGLEIDAKFVDFKDNTATHGDGGAVISDKFLGQSGQLKFRKSNFRDNDSTATSGVREHAIGYSTGAADINAKKNWWNDPTVSSSENSHGVNTINQLAEKVIFTLDAPKAPLTDPCGFRGASGDSRCLQIPTSTPTSVPSSTLADYGVTPSVSCTQTHRDAILAGTQKTGLAFLAQFGAVSVVDAFRRVMYSAEATGISFVCLSSTVSTTVCLTSNTPSGTALQAKIECGSQVQLSEYTVVHEYGHVFTGRMGGLVSGSTTYYGMIERPVTTLVPPATPGTTGTLFDSINQIVFGYRKEGSNNNLEDWTRGGRGWGSPASTPPAVPCNFQQDAYTVTDWQVTPTRTPPAIQTERDETAADMFLNWVYRDLNLAGFQNADQRTISICSTVAPTDVSNPGDARYGYMETHVMPALRTRVPTPTP